MSYSVGGVVGQIIERANVWIQILTSVSVILGFGLVVWQLQLTRDSIAVQFPLFNISDASADLSAVYGENAAEVLAKACFQPDAMSNSDRVVLQHYFSNKIYRIYNVYWQSGFNTTDDAWKYPASSFLSTILMYPQGAGFLKGVSFSDPDNSPIRVFIEEQIANGSTASCDEVLDRMKVE